MIRVEGLSYSYGSSPKVLDNISCQLEQGHCIAVLGNNGAGKSTLLKCLNRVLVPQEGEVLIDGDDTNIMPRREMAKKIAYVPQRSIASHTMVFDAVLLGRKPYINWDVTEEDRRIVQRVLKQLNLSEYSTRYTSELSGGELQKVVLARALAQESDYLLLDEPTSNLDPHNKHNMLRLIQDISIEQNKTVIIVIHDLNLAVRYCDRFLFLKDSNIYRYGGCEIVTTQTIEDVYGMKVEILEHRENKIIVPC
ncbi:MAG: ABC transporter ATP-binding protein [Clostridiales bacterium]|nr:ABC transporter ATP-binding protein [Clostridiales bacterium]